jgi:hypothetical protein
LYEDVYMIVQGLRYWRVVNTYDVYPQYDTLYVNRLNVFYTMSCLKMSQKLD